MTAGQGEGFRFGSSPRATLEISTEVQRRTDQQLLEAVVDRLGELFARVLLGQRQVRRQLAELSRPLFQFGRSLVKDRLGMLARRDVGHERNGPPPAGSVDVIQTHFDWERRPVAPLSREIEVEEHRTRGGKVLGAMLGVQITQGRRHQPLDGLANELARRPPEHHFESPVGGHDHALRIHRDDALRGGLQQQAQFAIALLITTHLQRLLDVPALGDVEFEPDEGCDRSVDVAVDASHALDPQHGAVGPYDPT